MLQNDNPRHIYAMPVLFKEQEELQYIMLCDCAQCEPYWRDLSGWNPQSMTCAGELLLKKLGVCTVSPC
jgi:hypothetical protein